jgi:hypothetical protein
MFTVWPWPGVTAWAVDSSASIDDEVLAEQRHAGRQRQPLVDEDHQSTTTATSSRTMIATKSRRCLRIADCPQRAVRFAPNGRSFLRSSGSALSRAAGGGRRARRRRLGGGRPVEVRERLLVTGASGLYGGRLPG